MLMIAPEEVNITTEKHLLNILLSLVSVIKHSIVMTCRNLPAVSSISTEA